MTARRTPLRVGPLTLKRAIDASIDERRSAVRPESATRALLTDADASAWVRSYDEVRGIARYSPPTNNDVEVAKRAITSWLRNGEVLVFRARRRGGSVPTRLFDDGSPDAQLPPETPVEEKTSWFEVSVVDAGLRPFANLALKFSAAGDQRDVKTNGAGIARVDDVASSRASVRIASTQEVRDELRARAADASTAPAELSGDELRLAVGRDDLAISLEAETPRTVVLVVPLTRVRLIGMHFDTNKAFMRESAMKGIRKIVSVYEENPNGKLLIVGHTDTVADDNYNLDLSVERAESVKAYLKNDVAAWEAWFADDKPTQKRWGSIEIHHMISALPCEQSVAGFQQFSNDSRGTVLKVDGIVGPKTRHELIAAYMELDGTTLPSGIDAEVHGCGEFFPAEETGAGVADAENRRVEIFCFDDEITPPVPGRRARKGEPEYEQWKKQVTRDVDFSVSDRVRLQITLLDEERSPRGHVSFELTVGAETVKSETDADGQLDVFVEGGATTGTLTAGSQSYELRLRELSSLDTIAGVQERLDNLAYSCTPTGEFDDETRDALKSFQRDEGLPVTSEIDGATKVRLKAKYGH